jgi:hypothetical protein
MPATAITKSHLTGWKARAMSFRSRYQNAMKKAEKATQTFVRTAEVGSAAFVGGFMQGNFGAVEVVGVPLDLGLGGALHLANLLGFGGKMGDHLSNFGDGFLACYLTTVGRGAGVQFKQKRDSGSAALPAGQPAASGHALTDAELSNRLAAGLRHASGETWDR